MALIEVDLHPAPRQLRIFGLAALLVFGALGTLARVHGGLFGWSFPDAAPTVAVVLWVVAGLSGLFAASAPGLNRPLYVALVVVSLPVGLVVSYVVLIILFYGLITPLGVVFRLIGRDALQRRFEPAAETYWEAHESPAGISRYFKQF